MADYSYTVTSNVDSTAYLWSGHGLVDSANPTLYFRGGDRVIITNTSGGHVMEIVPDDGSATITESSGVIDINPALQGNYTYRCTTHAAMTGLIYIGAAYIDQGPQDGYGTGPLPARDTQVGINQIRTKINEIITKGGLGGSADVHVGTSPPDNPQEGDLWFDTTVSELYVYDEGVGWIQTNGGSETVGVYSDIIQVFGAQVSNGDAVTNYVPEGTWLMSIQSQENSSEGGDEDIIAYHTEKYTVPTGEYLWFKGTNSTIFYQYTTDTTQPAVSDANWIEVTTNISGPGGGGGNSPLGTIWGFGLAVSATSVGSGGGASVTTSTTAPTNPSDGDLWFDESVAKLYVYIDGIGWMQTNGGSGTGGEGYGVTAMVHASSIRSDVVASDENAGTGVDWTDHHRLYDLNDITTSNTTWNSNYGINQTDLIRQGTFDPNGGPILVQVTYSIHNENTGGGASDQEICFVSQFSDVNDDRTRVVIFAANSPDNSSGRLASYINLTAIQLGVTQGGGGGETAINFIDKISVGTITYGSWTTVSGNDAWSGASSLIVHADSFDVDTGGNSSIELKVRASSSEPTEVLVIDHNGTSGGRQITQEQAFIPVASDGSFQYYITRDSTNATIRNFNVAGFLSSGGGTGGSGSGGGGPRAYVAFDGTAADMTAELASANSYNVSSITDRDLGRYTITYESIVPNGVVTVGNNYLYPLNLIVDKANVWPIVNQVSDTEVQVEFYHDYNSGLIYRDPIYVSVVVH